MTIILTTHYLEEAQEMCDEIAIIGEGELIVRDRTENLLARLDGKTLVVVPEGMAGDVALPPGVELDRRADGTLAFSYMRAETSAAAVFAALHAAGIAIRDVRTEEPDLEDVFVALTHRD